MKKLENNETSILYFFIIQSFFLFLGMKTFTKLNGMSFILVILIGSFIGYFFLNYYIQLLNKRTCVVSPILYFLIIPVSFLILVFTTNKMNSFIQYNILQNTNLYLITSVLLLLIFYLAKKKMNVIVRTCELFLWFFIILFLLILISTISYVDFTKIKPIFNDIHFVNLVKGITLYIIITISSIYPLFFLPNKGYKKELKKLYFASSLYILLFSILIVGVLGMDLTNLYPYPEISILKKISFLNIIDRMEPLFSIILLFPGFIYLAVHFSILNESIISLFQIKKRAWIYIVTLLLLFIIQNQFEISIPVYISLLVILMLLPVINQFLTRKIK